MADENKKIVVQIDYQSKNADKAAKDAKRTEAAINRIAETMAKAQARADAQIKVIQEKYRREREISTQNSMQKILAIETAAKAKIQAVNASAEATLAQIREKAAARQVELATKTAARLEAINAKSAQIAAKYEANMAAMRAKEAYAAQRQAERLELIQARAAARASRRSSGGGGGLDGLLGINLGGLMVGLRTNVLTAVLAGIVGAFAQAAQSVLGTLWGWAQTFAGYLRDAIIFAANYITDVERTFIALTSQGQSEIVARSPGIDEAEALQMAQREGAKYLETLRQIAIFSPFSEEDTRDIYRTLQAYGLAREEAVKLTQSLADYAAGAGRNSAQLQSLTLALAQIAGQGRVTGEELRQLANAGLPLVNVAQRMGMTVGELRALAKEGKATAEVVLPALIAEIEKYDGAARRAAENSFSGVMSSLRDLGPILLTDFFGPINAETGKMEGLFGALIPVLSNFVGILTSPQFRQAIQQIGKDLGNMATRAFSWGYNLMIEYGNGILSAAAAVIRAIARIGRIIASWLMPQSPPKILPNIDDWGREAMELWLAGFTQADANRTFSDLSSKLSGLFTAMFKRETGPDLFPQLSNLREQIGALVQGFGTGADVSGIRQLISSQFEGASEAVNAYIREVLALQTATSAVAKAQIDLNKEQEKYQKLLDAVDEELRSIRQATEKLDQANEIRKLNLILNSQYTTDQRKERARLRLQEIGATNRKEQLEKEKKTAIDAATERLRLAELEEKKAKERLALAELQIDYYKKEEDLLNQQAKALEALAKAAEKLAKGAGGDEGPVGGTGQLDFLKDLLGGNPKRQPVNLDAIFAPWKEGIDEIKSAWQEFMDVFNPGDLGQRWGAFTTFVTATYDATLGYTFNRILQDLRITEARFRQAFTAAGVDYNSFVAGVTAATLGSGPQALFGSWKWIVFYFITEWRKATDFISFLFRSTMGRIANMVQISLTLIKGDFKGTMQAIEEYISDSFEDAGLSFDKFKAGLADTVKAAAEAVRTAVNTVLDGIEAMVNEVIAALNKIPTVKIDPIQITPIPSIEIDPREGVKNPPDRRYPPVSPPPYKPPAPAPPPKPPPGRQKPQSNVNNYYLTTNTAATAIGVTNRFMRLKALSV